MRKLFCVLGLMSALVIALAANPDDQRALPGRLRWLLFDGLCVESPRFAGLRLAARPRDRSSCGGGLFR